MLQIHIDTLKNCATLLSEDGKTVRGRHQFSRRWEALLLALLAQEAKDARALSTDSLNAVLAQRGQSKHLNRAQILRLLQSLQTFFDAHVGAGLRVETPPRKSTVGPWLLRHEPHVHFCVDGEIRQTHWPHPGITPDPGDDESLYQVLSVLLVADALASEGRFMSAIDVLSAIDRCKLREEALGLVSLRLCSWHKHVGNFVQARALAMAVIQRSAPADLGLRTYAQFMLQRIDYDENPTGTWERLWQTTVAAPVHQLPQSEQGSDWRTLSEWHNMRALLARRRLHALINHQGSGGQPPSGEDTAAALHAQALQHYQAAMYMAAWFRDWDRLQAYVANLAYHMQSLLGLAAPLGSQAPAVLRWHRLTMAYEDKFSAGRDSAWEYIFFGKFWLDNHATLSPGAAIDPLAHNLGDTSPERETFYARALERLRDCGDDRQVAIGHSLYLRFAQQHLNGRAQEAVLAKQSEDLYELLIAQPNSTLLAGLRSEGYDRYWPEALRERLRSQTRKRNK